MVINTIVKLFNFYYFIPIIICLLISVLLYYILRKCSEKQKYRILLLISFLNLALHFAKLFFEPYRSELPSSIRQITFTNICAISTLFMPFVLLGKNQYSFNYLFFIAVLGGGLALFYPTEAFNKSLLTFDVIRFYICHYNLIMIPLMLAIFGVRKPTISLKSMILIPICFLMIEALIFVNELVLHFIGFVEQDWTLFFNTEYRNTSFVFGPIDTFGKINNLILIFVPNIFKKNLINVPGLDVLYWPVIWMLIPSFIYLPIVYFIMAFPFNLRRNKS